MVEKHAPSRPRWTAQAEFPLTDVYIFLIYSYSAAWCGFWWPPPTCLCRCCRDGWCSSPSPPSSYLPPTSSSSSLASPTVSTPTGTPWWVSGRAERHWGVRGFAQGTFFFFKLAVFDNVATAAAAVAWWMKISDRRLLIVATGVSVSPPTDSKQGFSPARLRASASVYQLSCRMRSFGSSFQRKMTPVFQSNQN